MQIQKSRNNLIIIYGLPGSGKSTLASTISNKMRIKNPESRIEIIDPDNIEQELKVKEKGADFHPADSNPNEFNSQIWNQSRQIALQSIKNQFSQENGKQSSEKNINTIIYEDTMLKKGYRRRFRAFCRQNKVQYLEIYNKLDLDSLLRVNQAREEGKRLPKEIVYKNYSEIELDSYALMIEYGRHSKSIDEFMVTMEEILNKSLEYFELVDEQERKTEKIKDLNSKQLKEQKVRNYIGELITMIQGLSSENDIQKQELQLLKLLVIKSKKIFTKKNSNFENKKIEILEIFENQINNSSLLLFDQQESNSLYFLYEKLKNLSPITDDKNLDNELSNLFYKLIKNYLKSFKKQETQNISPNNNSYSQT